MFNGVNWLLMSLRRSGLRRREVNSRVNLQPLRRLMKRAALPPLHADPTSLAGRETVCSDGNEPSPIIPHTLISSARSPPLAANGLNKAENEDY